MVIDDTFRTLAASAAGEFRDRGSKFLAYAYPILDEAAVKPLLDELRIIHPKAVHHCYAYRLGQDRLHYRANDDGEPSGSAGRPILNVLYSRELTNVLVVVVRYFGGTLLGVPGLINAYKTATITALDGTAIIEQTINVVYQVRYPFARMNEVMRVVKELQLPVQKQTYDTDCLLQLAVRKSLTAQTIDRFSRLPDVAITETDPV